MRILLLLILLLGILEARALDMKQIITLKIVKNIALRYPDSQGHTYEKVAMAICMSETHAGKAKFGDKQLLKKGIKQASYGVMQVRLATARFVAKTYRLKEVLWMNDTQLIKKLMHDIAFNAKIAVLYIVWLHEHSKNSFEAISRYNGGRVNRPYYKKVRKNLLYLSRYNI
ncbi:MAG: hypothetical protein B6D59_07730 [Campylobacteraceae bacterium 4484_4]|nr:MAG: hypothetical protein B6D59_07730 [Campylobacteraceae bacterium 4484_4]